MRRVLDRNTSPSCVRSTLLPHHRRRLHCDATTRTYQPAQKPLIKVCGVTNAGDAELAAKAGADFVGMILWAKARRAVSVDTAAKISEAARKAGAEPVGVFVDENFADIVRVCKKAGIKTAQLHGKGARGSLHDLPNWLEVIYVMHAAADGTIQTKDSHTPLGDSKGSRRALMYTTGDMGGSGEAYDWERLKAPTMQPGMRGWLLAGGLTPQNVCQAISLAQPSGVDVSSGVTAPDGLHKDPDKVFRFIEEVRRTAVSVEAQQRS